MRGARKQESDTRHLCSLSEFPTPGLQLKQSWALKVIVEPGKRRSAVEPGEITLTTSD